MLVLCLAIALNACNKNVPTDAASVDSAISRTLVFLQSNILENGEFPSRYCNEDGRFLACESDHSTFPTTFTVDTLAGIDNPIAAKLVAAGAAYLESIKENGDLWRYWQAGWRGRNMPYDLDDTSCARAALIKSGRTETYGDTSAYMRNQQADGSINVWIGIEQNDIDCAANANMLYYLSLENRIPGGLVEYLKGNLEPEKARACNIWYKTPLSFYYFMARAVRSNSELKHLSPLVVAQVEKLRLSDASFGSMLETALGAATLFILKETLDTKDEQTLSRLLSMQRKDGSFPAEPFYIERKGTYFESEAVSSAFALDALATWKKRAAVNTEN